MKESPKVADNLLSFKLKKSKKNKKELSRILKNKRNWDKDITN
jgi:hypothetical protein